MELNAEQIKKQMQDWSNGICENACLKGECLNGIIVACENCMPNTVRNALALITSQEQRIKELTEENERLREDNEIKSQKRANIFEIANAFDRGRTDGVRKMQEALEHRIHSKLSYHGWYLKETVIDQIAKEMLEGVT